MFQFSCVFVAFRRASLFASSVITPFNGPLSLVIRAIVGSVLYVIITRQTFVVMVAMIKIDRMV